MRVVLDADALVSAHLVGGGAGTAPRRVLRSCLEGRAVPLMGTALHAEYDDVLRRDDLFARSPLSPRDRESLFDALLSVCAQTPVYHLRRPNLPDAGDDHPVELAPAGNADWIVTANLRDLSRGELRFGHLRIGTAGDVLDDHDRQKTPRPS